MVVVRFSLALLLCAALHAQGPAPAPQLQIPPAAQAGPGFDPQTATRAYLDTLGSDKRARSDAYFEGGYWLILWDLLYGAAVSLLLLTTGLSTRMRDMAERTTGRKPAQTALYWTMYSSALFILGFPLAVYEGYMREHQYGLSNQSFGEWMIEQSKELGLSIILGGVAVMALFGIVRLLPRSWHIWGAGAAILFLMIGMIIGPVFIAPLFNQYTVLDDARIRDPILRIARQNGIPASKVYQVDASRQSKRVSANVSGFLGTDRITLNDNLLKRSSPQGIMAVMGHEMGHYVLNHVYKMLAFLIIVTVVFFAILRWALVSSLARWGRQWGIRDMGDPAILPLAVLILSVLSFLFTPIDNTLIRTQEYEADIFGLNTSRQPDGFAEAALLLSEYRKMEPGRLEEVLLFDHPSGRTRIYSAMRWKAENKCLGSALEPCNR